MGMYLAGIAFDTAANRKIGSLVRSFLHTASFMVIWPPNHSIFSGIRGLLNIFRRYAQFTCF